jgi:hypothetical protein
MTEKTRRQKTMNQTKLEEIVPFPEAVLGFIGRSELPEPSETITGNEAPQEIYVSAKPKEERRYIQ